jgi:hypothetical protein
VPEAVPHRARGLINYGETSSLIIPLFTAHITLTRVRTVSSLNPHSKYLSKYEEYFENNYSEEMITALLIQRINKRQENEEEKKLFILSFRVKFCSFLLEQEYIFHQKNEFLLPQVSIKYTNCKLNPVVLGGTDVHISISAWKPIVVGSSRCLYVSTTA